MAPKQAVAEHDTLGAAVATTDPHCFAPATLWMDCEHDQAAEPLSGDVVDLAHVAAPAKSKSAPSFDDAAK
jgi:hypothetical protein